MRLITVSYCEDSEDAIESMILFVLNTDQKFLAERPLSCRYLEDQASFLEVFKHLSSQKGNEHYLPTLLITFHMLMEADNETFSKEIEFQKRNLV